jgi:hypothetical protein
MSIPGTTKIRKHIKETLPPKLHVRLMYYHVRKERLNFRKPVSYSEKLQWLKVYGKLERYTNYADKYEVRSYVEDRIGKEHLIPLIGVWDKFDDIPFDELPNQFALKATHGSGYNIIVKDKSTVNKKEMAAKVNKWMSENYYYVSNETQYKLCKPKIVVEQYMEDESGELRDYKIDCINGEPKIVMIMKGRSTVQKIDFMDTSWNKLPVTIGQYPNLDKVADKPANLDDMLEAARKLSRGFTYVRVDLYSVNNKVYFSELTFTPGSGLNKFYPSSIDYWIGEQIDLAEYVQSTN